MELRVVKDGKSATGSGGYLRKDAAAELSYHSVLKHLSPRHCSTIWGSAVALTTPPLWMPPLC